MSNVSLINYSTREFTTKGEMDSYIRKQDEIFTEEVTKIFIEAGMLRRVVTQIWNKKETFRDAHVKRVVSLTFPLNLVLFLFQLVRFA